MIHLIILLFLIVFLGFSARFNFWRLNNKGIPVLMYHMISEEKKDSKINKLRVSPEKFEKQMKYLNAKGYETISFSDLLKYFKSGKLNVKKPVIITFDDGYRDNYTNAFPILKKYNLKAAFFLVSDFIGEESFWNMKDRDKLLSLEEIKEMLKEGMEFGSHSATHPLLVNYPRGQLFHEIGESKRLLEKMLGTEIKCFSYPFGKVDEETRMVVEKCGYIAACTTRMGKVNLKDGVYTLKRILVRGDENMFDFYLQLKKGKNRL